MWRRAEKPFFFCLTLFGNCAILLMSARTKKGVSMVDLEDIAYEDSVSSDTGFAFDGEPAVTWEEDPTQHVDFPEPTE